MLELINNIIYLQRKPKYKLLQSSKRTKKDGYNIKFKLKY